MKTFRLIYTGLCALLLCVNFAACSSDDDDEGSEYASLILGTWKYEKEDYIETYTFYRNGTYFYSEEEWYNNSRYSDDIDGTYQLRGDKLTLVEDDGDTDQYIIVKLTGSKLILEYDDDEHERYTYTKVDDDDTNDVAGYWTWESSSTGEVIELALLNNGNFRMEIYYHTGGEYWDGYYTGTYGCEGDELELYLDDEDEKLKFEFVSVNETKLKLKLGGKSLTFTRDDW